MERDALMLAALKDAGRHPEGLPLFRVGKNTGLFPNKNAAAQDAAQAALAAGYLETVKAEGKADAVRLTARGEAYLREHLDPKNTLEELLSQLRTTQTSLPRWLAEIDTQLAAFRVRMQTFLEHQGQELARLIHRAESALRRLEAGPALAGKSLEPWHVEVLQVLGRQASTLAFPTLYGMVQQAGFDLTVPDFHNGLLLLRDRGNLTLTEHAAGEAPLAEPEYALVDEGCIYVSAGLA